jgi:hypothetical protein
MDSAEPAPLPDASAGLSQHVSPDIDQWRSEAPALAYLLEHPDAKGAPKGAFARGVLEGTSKNPRGRRNFERGWRRDAAKRARRLSATLTGKAGFCTDGEADSFAGVYMETFITRPDDSELCAFDLETFYVGDRLKLDYGTMRGVLDHIQRLLSE